MHVQLPCCIESYCGCNGLVRFCNEHTTVVSAWSACSGPKGFFQTMVSDMAWGFVWTIKLVRTLFKTYLGDTRVLYTVFEQGFWSKLL